MSKADSVLMRPWEAVIYRAYDWLIAAVLNIPQPFRKVWVRIKEAIERRFEYYMAADGTIKLRRSTGASGVYIRSQGKLIKLYGTSAKGIDDMSIIGWQEVKSGQYDEDLGTVVESKQHYKRLMKDKGLVPLEPSQYCGSSEYRRKKLAEYNRAKSLPTIERSFIEAARQYGAELPD